MSDLAPLTAAVSANTNATNAVVTALNTARSESDQGAIDALTATITANNTTLAGAADPSPIAAG